MSGRGKRPLKIGVICYPSYGGSGVVASELGKQLAARGHCLHFVSWKPPFRLRESVNLGTIKFHQLQVPDYDLFRYPPYLSALSSHMAEVVESENLDIIHAHYAVPHAAAAYLAREMVGGHRVKTVTTVHGTDITLVGMNPALSRMVAFSLERSDAVTAVSNYLNGAMKEIFSLERDIETIYNFIDQDAFDRRDTGKMKRCFAEPEEKVVVHISNFRPVKRAPMVVETFARVCQRVSSRLILAGAGPELPVALERGRELGVSHRIHSLGEQDSVVDILSMADVMLLPSIEESFGLSALEAMACRVPVVASRIGGLPELVDHGVTGYLVSPDDVEGMAEGVQTILQDEGLAARMGAAARARAAENFSSGAIVSQYEEVYWDLLERGAAQAGST